MIREESRKLFDLLKLQAFIVYALNSLNNKFIYVGMTENLNDRIVRHNKGYVHSTKLFAPFELIYTEKCGSGQQAREREKFLKSLGKD